MVRFLSMEQLQPFSPLWEAYVCTIMQPLAQRRLTDNEGTGVATLTENAICLLKKQVELHPFNLSHAELNEYRAWHMLSALNGLRRLPLALGIPPQPPDWWPRDPAALVELLKKEREEVDTLGCINVGAKREPEVAGALNTTPAGANGASSSKTVSALKRKHAE